MISLEINGERFQVEDDPKTPLLWVPRDSLDLAATGKRIRKTPLRPEDLS